MVSTSWYGVYFLVTEFQVCTPFAYPVSRKTLLFCSFRFEGFERQKRLDCIISETAESDSDSEGKSTETKLGSI